MKPLYSARHYPSYHGQLNTAYSWRSFHAGQRTNPGNADYLLGYVPDDIPDGWILGPRGNPVRTLPRTLRLRPRCKTM